MISWNRSIYIRQNGGDLISFNQLNQRHLRSNFYSSAYLDAKAPSNQSISFNLLNQRHLRSNLYPLALLPSTSSQFYANKMFSMHMNISPKLLAYA